MAVENPWHSYGTKLEFSTNNGSSYTELECITNIDDISLAVTQAETTCLRTDNRTKTFISGFIDGGQLVFTMRYSKEMYSTLLGNIAVDDILFRLTYPDTTTTETFHGQIQNVQNKFPADDIINTDVTIKVSTFPTFTPG